MLYTMPRALITNILSVQNSSGHSPVSKYKLPRGIPRSNKIHFPNTINKTFNKYSNHSNTTPILSLPTRAYCLPTRLTTHHIQHQQCIKNIIIFTFINFWFPSPNLFQTIWLNMLQFINSLFKVRNQHQPTHNTYSNIPNTQKINHSHPQHHQKVKIN